MADPSAISWFSLAVSPALLLIPVLILVFSRVRLLKDSLIAVVRMAVQLLFVGVYLGAIFKYNQLWLTLLWVLAVILVADVTVVKRSNLPFRKIAGPVFLAMFVGMMIPLMFVVGVVLREIPFLDARTTIPLCGMIMGNCMKNVIIALRTFYDGLKENRKRFLYAMSLGATQREALFPFYRHALADALAPQIANMSTTGLVTLPGMMTGVMMGGASPMAAVQYQWLLMLSIFTASSLTILLAVHFSVKRLLA